MHPRSDPYYWKSVFLGMSLLQQTISAGIFCFFWWIKYRIIVRAGYSGWWKSLLWSIPIVGWFFKIWFAFTPWPVRSKRKKASVPKRKARKRVAA